MMMALVRQGCLACNKLHWINNLYYNEVPCYVIQHYYHSPIWNLRMRVKTYMAMHFTKKPKILFFNYQ